MQKKNLHRLFTCKVKRMGKISKMFIFLIPLDIPDPFPFDILDFCLSSANTPLLPAIWVNAGSMWHSLKQAADAISE